MSKLKSFSILLLIAFAAMMYSCKSSTAPTTTGTYHIVSPSETMPYGHTWAQWQANWWDWCMSFDSLHFPLNDLGKLDAHQSGSVWFLGGIVDANPGPGRTQTIRSGIVPLGTALFFPLLNQNWDTTIFSSEYPGHTPPLDSLGIIDEAAWNGYVKVESAEVDGHSITNLSLYHHDTTRFIEHLVSGNWYTTYPDTSVGVDIGDYLMIDSLSFGSHTIHFHSEETNVGFLMDVTYKLTVQ